MLHHIGIWGRTQSGKTTRAKLILASRHRVVVLDPLDEYGQVAPARAETLADVLATIKDRWRGDFRIRYVPGGKVDPAPALDLLSAMLLSVQEPFREGRDNRQVTLAVDEMALAAPNVRKPSQGFGPCVCAVAIGELLWLARLSEWLKSAPHFAATLRKIIYFPYARPLTVKLL